MLLVELDLNMNLITWMCSGALFITRLYRRPRTLQQVRTTLRNIFIYKYFAYAIFTSFYTHLADFLKDPLYCLVPILRNIIRTAKNKNTSETPLPT